MLVSVRVKMLGAAMRLTVFFGILLCGALCFGPSAAQAPIPYCDERKGGGGCIDRDPWELSLIVTARTRPGADLDLTAEFTYIPRSECQSMRGLRRCYRMGAYSRAEQEESFRRGDDRPFGPNFGTRREAMLNKMPHTTDAQAAKIGLQLSTGPGGMLIITELTDGTSTCGHPFAGPKGSRMGDRTVYGDCIYLWIEPAIPGPK